MATPTGTTTTGQLATTTSTPSGSTKEYTAEDVAKHNTENDCWVILYDKVYDVTNFLAEHPGGKDAIMLFAG